jgi:hypothetical protein
MSRIKILRETGTWGELVEAGNDHVKMIGVAAITEPICWHMVENAGSPAQLYKVLTTERLLAARSVVRARPAMQNLGNFQAIFGCPPL